MKFRVAASCFLICLVSSYARAEEQKPQLDWAATDFPPFMILEGPAKGQGVWDELSRVVQANLPDFEHVDVKMTNSRFMEELKDGKNLCKIYFFKTPEREKYLYYSIPAVVFLTNHVVMRRETYEEMRKPDRIDLNELLVDQRFRGGFTINRSYALDMDTVIAANRNAPHLTFMVADNTSYFKMMAEGRLDYILDFPVAVAYWSKVLGLDPDRFVSVPIVSSTMYTTTYVVCTKNAWGAQLIDRINAILRKEIPTKHYLEMVTRWYDPQDRAQLETYYRECLLEAAAKP